MKVLLILITGLFISACSIQPVLIERVTFNPDEFQALPTSGTASITGEAFIIDVSGKKHFPINAKARLNPKTSYSKQWYEVNYLNRYNIGAADPRYLKYVRKTDIGEDGHFSFKNIPAGDYYISAPIFWMKEYKLEDGSVLLKRTGAFVCYEIRVEDDKAMLVQITTGQDFNVVSSM